MKGFGRGNSLFTPEERAHIVREFEESTLTSLGIAQKYHIRNPHLVIIWRKRLRDSQKMLSLQSETIKKLKKRCLCKRRLRKDLKPKSND